MDNKELVRNQFGASASGYVTSEVHAKGKDLKWIVEEVSKLNPTPLIALDLATGSGHTAFALSSCVGRVVGLDLTPEMIQVAEQEADKMGLQNITWMVGDAEQIPFPSRLFDLITCRIAAHHFPKPELAFAEVYRCLVPGGTFILIDNYAPDQSELESLYNQVEWLRDPSHIHVYTLDKWSNLLKSAGYSSVNLVHTWSKNIEMNDWFKRAKTPETQQEKVMKLLSETSKENQQALGFDLNSEQPEFTLRKGMWVCTK